MSVKNIWIKKEADKHYTTVRSKVPPKRGRGSWIKLTVPEQTPECLEDFAGNSRQPGFWAYKWFATNDNGNTYPFYYFGGSWGNYQPRTVPKTDIPSYMLCSDIRYNGERFDFEKLRKGKILRPVKSYNFVFNHQPRARAEFAKYPEFKGKFLGHSDNVIINLPPERSKSLSAQAREKGWKVEQWGCITPRAQSAGALRIVSEHYIHLVYRNDKPWFATPNSHLANLAILKELGIDYFGKTVDNVEKPVKKGKRK